MSLLKRIGGQAMIYGLGYGFTRLLGFALLPLYTRYLTPAEYGVLALLTTSGQVAGILSQLGLGAAMFREVIYEETDRNKVESTIILFLAFVSALVLASAWYCSPALSRWMFGHPDEAWLLQLTFGGTAFGFLEMVLLARLRIRQQPRLYTALAVTRFLVGAGATIWFLVYLRRGLLGLVECTALVSALFALVYLAYLLPGFRLEFSTSVLKRLLRFGAPLVPASVSGMVTASSDRYFLQHYAGAAQVGVYSLGYTVGQVMAWFVNATQLAWPAHLFEVARQPDAEPVLSRILTVYSAVMATLALAVALAASEIVQLLATADYQESVRIVPWVAASYVFLGASYVVNSALAVRDKMKYSGLVAMSVAILNLGLNAWLIPRYGSMGAAWATFVSYVALAVMQTLANQWVWRIGYQYGRLALLAGGWLAAMYVAGISPLAGWPGMWLRLVLLVAYGGLAWAVVRPPHGPQVTAAS